MAYQAKRKQIYEEEFQLVEQDGRIVHTLVVSLDVDSVIRKLSEKHIALTRNLQEIQKMKNSSVELEKLGKTVIDLFEAVFGTEDTKVILEFYNNRYVEMCQEVLPFITNVVIPEVRKLAQENKKYVLSQYSRKQMRRIGRR